MLRGFARLSIVCILPLVATAAIAAEGRTPVFAPGTVLGVDGKYIVTRNIAAAVGAVLLLKLLLTRRTSAAVIAARSSSSAGGRISTDTVRFSQAIFSSGA